jgi:hypothetical protein
VSAVLTTAFADLVLELFVDCLELTTTVEVFELFVPLELLVDCFELPALVCFDEECVSPYEPKEPNDSEAFAFACLADFLSYERERERERGECGRTFNLSISQ